jgi:hypothetical protein
MLLYLHDSPPARLPGGTPKEAKSRLSVAAPDCVLNERTLRLCKLKRREHLGVQPFPHNGSLVLGSE